MLHPASLWAAGFLWMFQGKVVVQAGKGEKLVLQDEEVIENKVIKNWRI